MRKKIFERPTAGFPYRIPERLAILSTPKRVSAGTGEGMPCFTYYGVRQSALCGTITDRVNEAAYPYVRRCVLMRNEYKHVFSEERLKKIDRLIETTNETIYSKLANCTIKSKKQVSSLARKKKRGGWSDIDWKRHMEYINTICVPKKEFPPEPVMRGQTKPLEELLHRISHLTCIPEFKTYRRLSKESWYRDPIKVSPNAMKYVATDYIKKLAKPKAIASED